MYIGKLPENIKAKLKEIEQPLEWHPERTVFNHIWLVEKEAQKYNDVTLEICAVFHDLGKVNACQSRGDRNVFYGHEFYGPLYIKKYKHIFEDLDVKWDVVEWVCLNHMKAHVIKGMRPHKSKKLYEHEFWPYLMKFSECDNNGRGEVPDGIE